ncbi:MAG: YfjI family protein [Geminicoccaceae bacterium]
MDNVLGFVSSVSDTLATSGVAPVDPSLPWEEPRSLHSETGAPTEYPIDCLPSVIRRAVLKYQEYGQQPMAMVACSALSVVSLACQALANVSRDGKNLDGPCSLFFLVVAESGERKTACDNRFARPVREWLETKRQEDIEKIVKQINSCDEWEQRKTGLEKAIERAASSLDAKKRQEVTALREELNQHLADKPKRPPTYLFFMEDTNLERLASDLQHAYPTTCIRSDEAGLIVGSHSMNEERAMAYLAFINRLWDGNSYTQRRIGRGVISVEGRRVTVSLMMQEVVLRKLLAIGDGVARGTGALARFLITAPESTAGMRMFKRGDLSAPHLLQFDARIKELLYIEPAMKHPKVELKPPVIGLNDEAFEVWRSFHNHVEATLAPCGEFNEMKDFASKTPEQAARIACIFHVFEHGPIGEIDEATMKNACEIAWWHLHEARRLLGLLGNNNALKDAQALLEWLGKKNEPTASADILRLGPARVRNKGRRDAALGLLFEHKLARMEHGPSRPVIAVHPSCRNPQAPLMSGAA